MTTLCHTRGCYTRAHWRIYARCKVHSHVRISSWILYTDFTKCNAQHLFVGALTRIYAEVSSVDRSRGETRGPRRPVESKPNIFLVEWVANEKQYYFSISAMCYSLFVREFCIRFLQNKFTFQ